MATLTNALTLAGKNTLSFGLKPGLPAASRSGAFSLSMLLARSVPAGFRFRVWPRHDACWALAALAAAMVLAGSRDSFGASSLSAYDSAVATDTADGLVPVARLTNVVTLTGSNLVTFNFGANSGDATMEFILEGRPGAGSAGSVLAMGTNSTSSLRCQAPGTGAGAQTTTTHFDTMSRGTNIVQTDGAIVNNVFSKRGELLLTSGSRNYPVGYSYDAQGRMKTMTNWSTFSS